MCNRCKLVVIILFLAFNNIHAGIDLYSGSFSRYYAENWKDSMQLYAEANNIKYRRIRPIGKQTICESLSITQEKMTYFSREWMLGLCNTLDDMKFSMTPWDESLDAEYRSVQIFPSFYEFIEILQKKNKIELSFISADFWLPYDGYFVGSMRTFYGIEKNGLYDNLCGFCIF